MYMHIHRTQQATHVPAAGQAQWARLLVLPPRGDAGLGMPHSPHTHARWPRPARPPVPQSGPRGPACGHCSWHVRFHAGPPSYRKHTVRAVLAPARPDSQLTRRRQTQRPALCAGGARADTLEDSRARSALQRQQQTSGAAALATMPWKARMAKRTCARNPLPTCARDPLPALPRGWGCSAAA